MNTERERIREARKRTKNEFAAAYESISSLLFEIDPMGISFEFNTDEYEPEVDTILPRIKDLNERTEIELVVREEFGKWFGNESTADISDETFERISEGILKIKTGEQVGGHNSGGCAPSA
jgi:hypothetical protein